MPEENVISHPLVRDGKSQAERRDIGALSPDTLQLDNRSEQQLLTYLYEYAKSITYYDTDMQTSNWQAFLLGGVAVQASVISQFNAETLDGAFGIAEKNFSEGLSKGDLAPILDFLFETALQINQWHDALDNDTAFVDGKLIINENDLRRFIGNLIASNLQQNLLKLIAVANIWSDKSIVNERREYEIPDLSILKNNDLWGSLDYAALSSRDAVLKKKQYRPIEFAQAAQEKLNEIFQTFSKAIREIVAAAITIDVTPPTQTHDPHLALLYAFLRLFKYINDDLNKMPKRHLDFFYRDVLGLTTKPHIPDAAHVVFDINKPYDKHKLNAGTAVKDGKDSLGSDILFSLQDEVIVDKAQIKSLRTIFKNKKLHAAPVANSADGAGTPFNDPLETHWHTLGKVDDNLMARVGLMAASSILLLPEGNRKITLTFTTSPSINFTHVRELFSYEINDETLIFFKANKIDATKLSKKVYAGTEAEVKTLLKTELNYPATVLDADVINSFTKTGIFKIELTGKKGWFQPKGVLTFGTNTIDVTLTSTEEAITGADPSVLKADFGTNDPLIRLTLNPHILSSDNGLYNIFKNIELSKLEIKADVSEVKTLVVKTDEGVIDATKTFMPFGAVPGAGSGFTVLTENLTGLTLSKLDIVVEWDKLPAEGFVKHYEAYAENNYPNTPTIVPIIKNNWDFRVKINNQAAIPLFTENTSNGALLTKKTFALGATSSAANAIVFELNTPPDFLHSKFARALIQSALGKNFLDANIASANSFLGSANGKAVTERGKVFAVLNTLSNAALSFEDKVNAINALLPIGTTTSNQNDLVNNINSVINTIATLSNNALTPNPPYTPIIKSISMNYTASTEGVKLWHLHPFEEQNVEKIAFNSPLLPQFNDEGTLLIGLSDAAMGGTVRLFFQLLESSADAYLPVATINWQVLNGNAWLDLKDGEHILDDDTEGFIRSGIVQINIPFGLNRAATTILPPQLLWLKASAPTLTESVCQTIGVYTQAAKAVFAAGETNDLTRLKEPLKAAALAKLAEPDAFIKGVTQPFESFDGRAPEEDAAFYGRVSERLRHKGRAITLYDYEQLVLDAFPEIYKVKCITHTLASRSKGFADRQMAPGYVAMVVIPNVSKLPMSERLEPKASRRLLDRISDFLEERISPFVRLRVMNPVYDKINVTVDVVFKQGKSPEFYNEQLGKDLEKYFAPWAYAPDAPIPFGGTIFKSAVVGFIESLDYVDYITYFKMKKGEAEMGVVSVNSSDKDILQPEEITTSSARAIFVSGNHKINKARPIVSLFRVVKQVMPPVG